MIFFDGFEEKKEWTPKNKAKVSFSDRVGPNTKLANTGSYAYRVATTGFAGVDKAAADVTPGAKYTASVSYKVESVTGGTPGPGSAYVRFYDHDAGSYIGEVRFNHGETEWTTKEASLTIEGGTTKLGIGIYGRAGSGASAGLTGCSCTLTFLVDDITVTLDTPAAAVPYNVPASIDMDGSHRLEAQMAGKNGPRTKWTFAVWARRLNSEGKNGFGDWRYIWAAACKNIDYARRKFLRDT